MPELSAIHIVLFALLTVGGSVLGWVLRGRRASDEKSNLNAGWQDQLHAQRTEHDRLVEQNKGLMDQISQFQASSRDAQSKSKELAGSLDDANAKHAELQHEIKAVRGELESALTERERMRFSAETREAVKKREEEKDAEIAKLRSDLQNWQDRVAPLIQNFRSRNEEVQQLESELADAGVRIDELERELSALEQTRIEPVNDPDELTDGRDASNDSAQLPRPDAYADAADDSQPSPLPDFAALPSLDVSAPRNREAAADVASNDDLVDAATHRDDLQAIKGIGPAIQKTLNEMGIFSFAQIADMSEYEIDRIARRLRGFHSRIYREDWIGQARELRDQSPGD